MDTVKCVWYVSGFRHPWEAAVIGSLAAALKVAESGDCRYALRVYAGGGTANFRSDAVLSWNALTFFEKMKIVLFSGKLWHLWGDAPFWWGWVRLRARTAHTSLGAHPEWRGHPTRLFEEQAIEGESRIVPTFELKATWASEDEDAGLLLAVGPAGLSDALKEALADSGIEGVPLETAETEQSLRRGKVVFVDDSPTNALLAAYLTLRGVPVMTGAAGSPLLRALLGPGGYTAPRSDDKAEWKRVLDEAMSETGRAASASARHFLKENYSASDAAESLKKLYRTMIG